MRHRAVLSLATLLALLLPAAADAGVTEFPIEPGAPATAHAPLRIRVAPDGNLWYVDQGTAANIGRISTAGERLVPLAGTGAAPPTDVLPRTISYIVTSSTGAIRRSLNNTGDSILTTVNTTALTEDDTGVVYHGLSDGSICVGASCVRPYTTAVNELVLDADGRVWAAYPSSDAVVAVTFADPTLQIARNVPLPAGSQPLFLAAGPDGNVWVTSFAANAVDRVTPAGTRTRFALPPGTGPLDIDAGPDGALWIAGGSSNAILRVTTAGVVTNTVPVPTPGAAPTGITAGPDGAIWFTEFVAGRIGRLTLDPTTVRGPAGAGGGTVGGAGGSPLRDRVAPRLLRTPTFAPASVRAGRSTTLSLRLSEAADLKLTVARRTTGRRVGGRCVKRTVRNRSRTSCRRYLTAVTLRRTGVAGTNALTVSARRLAAGTYRVTIVATDPAGNEARPTRVTLTVLPRR